MVEIKGVGKKTQEILLPFYQVILCFFPSENQELESYQYKRMSAITVVDYAVSVVVGK